MTLMRLWVADKCLPVLPHPPGIFPSLPSLVPAHYVSFIAEANFMVKFIECSLFCLFSGCGHMDLIQINVFLYYSLTCDNISIIAVRNHTWTQAATASMFIMFNSDTLASNESLFLLDSLSWDASMSIFHACFHPAGFSTIVFSRTMFIGFCSF